MDIYRVGTGNEIIDLQVDVSTLGLAASRALLVDINGTAVGTSVASSSDATGDISPTGIGKANFIKGKRVSIFTRIDLTGSDLETRKREFEQLSAKYFLKNGPDGDITFQHPDKRATDDYLTVFLHKPIDLI